MSESRIVPIIWLLPDPHLGHSYLVKKNIRPAGFEEQIIKFIKTHVLFYDVLICLGDFTFFGKNEYTEKFAEASKCTKWLTRGNHDERSIHWYLSHGFNMVADEIKLTIYGKVVLLSHIPIVNRNDFDICIHGHLHSDGHRADVPVNEKCVSLAIDNRIRLFNLRTIVDKFTKVGYYDCYKHN